MVAMMCRALSHKLRTFIKVRNFSKISIIQGGFVFNRVNLGRVSLSINIEGGVKVCLMVNVGFSNLTCRRLKIVKNEMIGRNMFSKKRKTFNQVRELSDVCNAQESCGFIEIILKREGLTVNPELLFELKRVASNNLKFSQIYAVLNNSDLHLEEMEEEIENICLEFNNIAYKNINNFQFKSMLEVFKNSLMDEFNQRRLKNKGLEKFRGYFTEEEALVVISLRVLSNCFFIVNKDSIMLLKQSVISYFNRNIFNGIYRNLYNKTRKKEIARDSKIERELIMVILDSLVKSGILETCKKGSTDLKERSKQYYTLNQKILEYLIDYTDQAINLPMVCVPIKWDYIDYRNYDSFGGGYLLNRKLSILNNVYEKDIAKFKIDISDEGINNINYLQSKKFRINKNILSNALTNPIFIDNFNNSFKKLTFVEFGEGKNYDEYKKYVQKNSNYYNLILLALIYLDKYIYFNVVSDNRGRMYYHSFPLSPQGVFLSRHLLGYYNEDKIDLTEALRVYEESFYRQIDESSFIRYLFLKDNSKKESIKFGYISEEYFYSILDKNNLKDNVYITQYESILANSPHKPFVYGDVTSSGFQIMGLINGDADVLYYTNLIPEPNDESARDFYKFFFDKVKKIGEKDYPNIINLFDRKLYKQIIMNMGYSQKFYRRSDIIREHINDKYHARYYDYDNSNNDKIFFKKMYRDINKVSRLFDLIFKTEFESIHSFMKVISSYTRKKSTVDEDGVFLMTNTPLEYVKTRQIYYNTKFMTLTSLNSDGSMSKHKLAIPNVEKSHLDIDGVKMQNSVIPNWIHLFDANIAHDVVDSFRKSNSHINTIHDSFGVKIEDFPRLKRVYFETLKKINKSTTDPIMGFYSKNKINEEVAKTYRNVDDFQNVIITLTEKYNPIVLENPSVYILK